MGAGVRDTGADAASRAVPFRKQRIFMCSGGPGARCCPTVSDQGHLLAVQVIKTTKQTSTEAVTYPQALKVGASTPSILLLAFGLAGTS